MKHTVSLALNGRSEHQSVIVDGEDISAAVCAATLTGGVDQVPRLTLELPIAKEAIVYATDVVIVLLPQTAAMLVQLGWKPPED